MAYNNDHTSSYFDQDLSASHFPPNFLFDDSRSSTPAQMTLNKTAPTWGPFSAIDASPKDPRPGWFISRGNSVLVPLIALDDLPDTVQLRDVPRFMVPKQTSGMEFLGEFPATGFKYNMSTVPPPPEVAAQHDRERSRTSAGLGLGVPRGTMQTGPFATRVQPMASATQESIEEVQSKIDGIIHSTAGRSDEEVSLTRRPLPPSGREPDQSRKVYCTHWIQSGECNYTQQGCLYKHEMPDRATLARIGFRTMPRWWQERRAQGLVPMQPAGQLHSRSTSGGTTGTDSTGSLHLGNPESQRFRRTHLPLSSTVPEPKAELFKKGPVPASKPLERLSTLADSMHAKKSASRMAPAPHARRDSTTSSHELNLLNLSTPPLLPAQQAAMLRVPQTLDSDMQSSSSASPNQSSQSEHSISAPPTSPSSVELKNVERKKGIYLPRTGQVVSPSEVHRPRFTTPAARNTQDIRLEQGSFEAMNRQKADAAVKRASTMQADKRGRPVSKTGNARATRRSNNEESSGDVRPRGRGPVQHVGGLVGGKKGSKRGPKRQTAVGQKMVVKTGASEGAQSSGRE